MDDLAGKISEFLSNPGAMEQIKGLAGLLGGQNSGSEPEPDTKPDAAPASPGPNLGNLGSLGNLGNLGNLGSLGSLGNLGGLLGGGGGNSEILQTVMKLAPLLQTVNQEDDSTRLLRALRPLLGAERQKKLDEAIKILQLMRILPLIKSSGLF